MRLIHLSDLHFGPPFLNEVAAALIRTLRAEKADVIVITGDFTQRARIEQFHEAQAFLQKLPDVPKMLVPGNHDIPLYRVLERIFSPYRLYQRYISTDLSPVLFLPGATIVGLNTTDPYRAIVRGIISDEQLTLCRRNFESSPSDNVRIVAMHHHLIPPTHLEKIEVTEHAGRALNLFHELGVDLVLGGHVHDSYVELSAMRVGDRSSDPIPIVHCGTTTSSRGRRSGVKHNAFYKISVTDTLIEFDLRTYDPDTDSFNPTDRRSIFRPNSRQRIIHSNREAELEDRER